MLSLLLVIGSSSVFADGVKACVVSSQSATQCCQNPLSHVDPCLDEAAKSLNKKIQAHQESVAKVRSGVRDAGREAKAQAQALKDSAALNLRLAETCERLSAECLTTCKGSTSVDAANAGARCEENAKLALGMKAQAERDATAAKRR